MIHAVFISYAAEDKEKADKVCSSLESRGIQCWIAPRDIAPGNAFQEAIVDAIELGSVVVLILSSSANASSHVLNEAQIADSKKIPFVTFRIEDVEPSKALGYHINKYQRMDAFGKDIKVCLQELATAVDQLIVSSKTDTGTLPAGAKIKILKEKKQRPVLFRLGLPIFTIGSALLGASTHLGGAGADSHLQIPVWVIWFSLILILLGFPLILLSKRDISHRWFWPGEIMFVLGLVEIPVWFFIWSGALPTPNFSHDNGFFALAICVFSLPCVIIGALCLWKGFPREGVKHRGAMVTYSLLGIAFLCSLVVWFLGAISLP